MQEELQRIGEGLRALVVDDDAMVGELIAANLSSWGFEVHLAANAAEAIDIFAAETPSVVVTDWMMPDTDGLQLIQRLRTMPGGDMAFILLLTGRHHDTDIVAGRRAGADDFLSKSASAGNLHAHLLSATRLLALHRRLSQRNAELTAANRALARANERAREELALAAQAQRRSLPQAQQSLPGLRVVSFILPSAAVSGDIFGYDLCGNDGSYAFLADVAGHGVPAAFQAVTLSRLIRPDLIPALRTHNPSPAAVVAELNDRFARHDDLGEPYFTMVLACIEPEQRRMRLTIAGHPPPLLTDAKHGVRFIDGSGFPVGMLPDVPYEDMTLDFSPGARLVLYSDGVTDCLNGDGVAFGEDRLREIVDEGADSALAELARDLRQRLNVWAGNRPPSDDASVVLLECPQ